MIHVTGFKNLARNTKKSACILLNFGVRPFSHCNVVCHVPLKFQGEMGNNTPLI